MEFGAPNMRGGNAAVSAEPNAENGHLEEANVHFSSNCFCGGAFSSAAASGRDQALQSDPIRLEDLRRVLLGDGHGAEHDLLLDLLAVQELDRLAQTLSAGGRI